MERWEPSISALSLFNAGHPPVVPGTAIPSDCGREGLMLFKLTVTEESRFTFSLNITAPW